jgi:hypothetical protein
VIPEAPPSRGPGQDGGKAKLLPRYEDIVQDGRLQLSALMPGLGAAVWRSLLSQIPAIATFRAQGIAPILRRLVAVGEERSVSVNVPVEYTGSFRLAREKGGERLFANMWLEARAPIASTLGPEPGPDAPRELVGRVFAEHVLTRPFGPPEERKVTRLDAAGVPAVPEDEHEFLSAESLLESAGCPLDDAGDFVFGALHTDSNQHVNSLVYPRVFEEAVVRRLVQNARIPGAQGLLARAIELRWRRPFFTGERAQLGMRLIEPGAGDAWKVGAIGAFSSGGPKPSCAVKLLLR